MARNLRPAEQLIAPAIAETVSALDPPPSDAAVVRLAEVVAGTIDGMEDGQRGMMLGQTAPLLLKLLQELEERARRRRAKDGKAGPNWLQQQRSARAAADTTKRKSG
jgi:hypothetical protein